MITLLSVGSVVAVAAGVAIALAACCGAIGMSLVVRKAMDSVTKQPEIDSKIRTILILGLVFIETAIIYSLIIGLLLLVL